MILIAIPARLKSTRLEKKALAPIGKYPMLWWTWQKAKLSQLAQRVIIATDSQEIFNLMSSYGAECIMTSEDCQSGSDRIYEACQFIPEAEIIVNLQGDEPLMKPEVLDGCINTLLQNNDCQIATVACPFLEEEDFKNPNNVKVVFNSSGRALYFSRAPMAGAYLHIGLYAYKKNSLEAFCKMEVSRLEKMEKLEQLRALEAGFSIYIHQINLSTEKHFGVDTQADLELARKILTLQ